MRKQISAPPKVPPSINKTNPGTARRRVLAKVAYMFAASCCIRLPKLADRSTKDSVLGPSSIAYKFFNGELVYAIRMSDAFDIRLSFKPVGINGLYNFGDICIAPNGGTLPRLGANREWKKVTTEGSDWLGPYIVSATENIDSSQLWRSGYFTGGTHDSTNRQHDGVLTARNVLANFAADGIPLLAARSGFANEISIELVNLIQASNTTREVLEERYRLTMKSAECLVDYENRALESILIRRHYGLQVCASGFQDRVRFISGQHVGWVTPHENDKINAGPCGQFPSVYRICLAGPSGGLTMWVDPEYGIATRRPIDPTASAGLFNMYGVVGKAYEVMVSTTRGFHMRVGDSYAFRGGYVWGTET